MNRLTADSASRLSSTPSSTPTAISIRNGRAIPRQAIGRSQRSDRTHSAPRSIGTGRRWRSRCHPAGDSDVPDHMQFRIIQIGSTILDSDWHRSQPKMELRRTGSIWNQSAKRRSQTVRRVCDAIETEYSRPRFGNPKNPIDDLVFIVISNKTGPAMAKRTFRNLKRRFASWEELVNARLSEIRRLLKPAGLSDVKSRQLRAALGKICRDFGTCSLQRLKRLSAEEAEAYLTSLEGVSEKVAKCVMIYALNFDVLPVDAHVHRVATRLGWTSRKRADQCHQELEALVEPQYRIGFHVGCIAHGRSICRPTEPRCDCCVIQRYCMYFRRRTQ